MIIHMCDCSEGLEVIKKNLKIINEELIKFGIDDHKSRIILFNKIDLITKRQIDLIKRNKVSTKTFFCFLFKYQWNRKFDKIFI